MPDMNAEQLIQALGLSPHPSEGGFFRETYRAELPIPPDALPAAYAGAARAASTAIYYLLTPDTFSAMHRLPGDEIFHFYLGDPVEMLQLREDGSGEVVVLGQVLAAGMRPQVVVPGGVWQGSRLRDGGRYALLGTTRSPGFDFADFQLGERAALAQAYPAFAEKIHKLTR
jgi:predicted cupin superfamily sugar epimerase